MLPALEIRIIAYTLAGLLVFGGLAWGVHTLDSHHYERLAQAVELAQKQALSDAKDKVIAAQAAQKAAEDRADQETQKREQADTASRTAVIDSMRGLEAAVHRRLLPAAVGDPGALQGAQPGAAGDSRLSEVLGRFNASLERLIGACQKVDSARTNIISIEPKVSP